MDSSTLQLQINPKLENVNVYVSYDHPPVIEPNGEISGDWDERKTNREGYVAFLEVDSWRNSFVLIQAARYEDLFLPAIYMPHDDLVAVDLVALPPPIPQPVELPKLHVERRHFYTAEKVRLDLIMADSFQAYDRWLTGEDLYPIFNQLQMKGFNAIRVFGMDKAIPEQIGRPAFRPQDHGNYYSQIQPFCAYAALFGLYVSFVVFADTADIMPSEPEQMTHFNKVVEELKYATNTIGSLVNEYTEHENFVRREAFTRPQGMAFSSGSVGSDPSNNVTSPPWWDFDEFHPRRDRPSSIKDCCVVDHPNYLDHGMAILIDEPDRFGSNGNPDVEYCALQAGASKESVMGICFHSKDGLYARLLDPETSIHADAFVHALKGWY